MRLYDLGRKKLLRKCENKHIPHLVVDIKTVGERIICSDVQESVHFVKYRRGENQLVVFAGIFPDNILFKIVLKLYNCQTTRPPAG